MKKILKIIKEYKCVFIILSCFIVLLVSILTIIFIKNEKEKCLIQFDTIGGTYIENQYVIKNSKVIRPINPEKKGFVFIDWYYNDQIYNFNSKVKRDMILKAKFEADGTEKIYSVLFDSQGGSDVSTIEIAEGESITEPIPPEKDGYVFVGWFYNDELFDFSFVINNDITLVAHWIDKKDAATSDILYSSSRNTTKQNNSTKNDIQISSYKEIEKISDDEVINIISNLKGKWYYGDSKNGIAYIYGADSYILGKKSFELQWNNIDLYNKNIFPTTGYNSNIYLNYPISKNDLSNIIKQLNITYISKDSLVVANKYYFDRNERKIESTTIVSNTTSTSTTVNAYIKYGVDNLNVELNHSQPFKVEYGPVTKDISLQMLCYVENSKIGQISYNSNDKMFYLNAKNVGSSRIKCTNYYGDGTSKSIVEYLNVNVYKNDLKGIMFKERDKTMDWGAGVGAGQCPEIVFTPSNATNKNYKLSSSNPSVASIRGNCWIFNDIGTTTLTVTSEEGGFSDSIVLKFNEILPEKIQVYGCHDMSIGETLKVYPVYTPAWVTFTDRNLEFSAKSLHGESVLSVDSNGNVVALNNGHGQVTIKDVKTGIKGNCSIYVH